MPGLIILLVIAVMIIIVLMNRKDRIDVDAFVLESRAKERLERLTKLEEEYKIALRNADKVGAQNLGKKYYKEKTEYEYWEAALEPRLDMESLSDGEKLKINKTIKVNNLNIRKAIVATNERALACDIETLSN